MLNSSLDEAHLLISCGVVTTVLYYIHESTLGSSSFPSPTSTVPSISVQMVEQPHCFLFLFFSTQSFDNITSYFGPLLSQRQKNK